MTMACIHHYIWQQLEGRVGQGSLLYKNIDFNDPRNNTDAHVMDVM